MSTHVTSALDVGATAEALSRYRRRALRWTAAGAVLLTVGTATAGSLGASAGSLLALALILLAVGLGSLRLARRMARQLAATTWTSCAAVATPHGPHGAAVVLKDPASDALLPVAPMTTIRRHLVDPGSPESDGVLWWCGDPRTGGVVAPPGGGELVWVRAVRGPLRRQRTIRDAEQRGLLERPAPKPAPGVSLSKTPSAHPDPIHHRWIFRWVLLAGLAVLGLGIAASEAAYDDPQVELTVVKEAPDGSCVVKWKDPWNGTMHRGPFQCDPDRDPLLVGDVDFGWVVSYGPWEGDLYDYRWQGTVANDVNDDLILAGLAVTVIGLGGGTTRFVRRRRARREAAAFTGGRGPGPGPDGLSAPSRSARPCSAATAPSVRPARRAGI
ncbi:hypothetical protein HY68_11915 [Streptomyces sp. AcH 505]|uniref:hypothetical protein n=1 Tax=Streptomyces sp. AcH 505 TaxID=352211 RepID=UPI00059200FC|nr:hypothetical protein HY68_11915 [Streptomyces sp. AcH 505]